MVTRIAAFVTWAAVAASLVFWALRLWVAPTAAPAHASVVSAAGGLHGDLGRVLGADAPPTAALALAPQPQADPRFRLIGVVAPRAPGANAQGLALIATDGKPPKAYRVGAPVDGEMVLLAVRARGASLGPRGQPVQVDLELPALPPPATGTLPAAAMAGPASRMTQPLPRFPLQAPQGAPAPPAAQTDGDGDDDSEPQPDAPTRPTPPQSPPSFARPPT